MSRFLRELRSFLEYTARDTKRAWREFLDEPTIPRPPRIPRLTDAEVSGPKIKRIGVGLALATVFFRDGSSCAAIVDARTKILMHDAHDAVQMVQLLRRCVKGGDAVVTGQLGAAIESIITEYESRRA